MLYNTLITHRRSRSSTHRHVKYLNIQNPHITDPHGNDPTYSGFARRLLASTAKRVNTAFARPFKEDANKPSQATKMRKRP